MGGRGGGVTNGEKKEIAGGTRGGVGKEEKIPRKSRRRCFERKRQKKKTQGAASADSQ